MSGDVKTMRVAVVQLDMNQCYTEAQFLQHIERYVRKAASQGAQVVVFPEDLGFLLQWAQECFRVQGIRRGWGMTSMSVEKGWRGLLERCTKWLLARLRLNRFGEWLAQSRIERIMDRTFARLAQAYKVVIVGGSTYVRRINGLYNLSAVYDTDGSRVGEYVKRKLVDIEKAWGVMEGGEPKAIQTSAGKIGVCICYDLNTPDVVKALVEDGAQFICAPSGGWRPFPGYPFNPAEDMPQIERAKEFSISIVRPYCAGFVVPGLYFDGHTSVVDPKGDVIYKAPRQTVGGVHTLDLPLK